MNPIHAGRVLRAQLIASGCIKQSSGLVGPKVHACTDRIRNMDTNKAKTYKAVAILNAAYSRGQRANIR